MLKFQIYYTETKGDVLKKIYAHPYYTNSKPRQLRQNRRKKQEAFLPNLTPARVIADEGSFCSRQFVIKYIDDEINLNELCTFRLELSAFPYLCQEDVFVNAEL